MTFDLVNVSRLQKIIPMRMKNRTEASIAKITTTTIAAVAPEDSVKDDAGDSNVDSVSSESMDS